MKKRGKKAALELSIGTMIIIVLGVTMLIFGLVLIRNIYEIATDSVDQIGDEVMEEINTIFADETKKIVILLGRDKVAKIRSGTDLFGVGIGAQTDANNRIEDASHLQFMISLDDETPGNCIGLLGPEQTESFFISNTDTWLNSDSFEGSSAGKAIHIRIPEATQICTQKVFVKVQDSTIQGRDPVIVGQDFFTIQVLRSGLF